MALAGLAAAAAARYPAQLLIELTNAQVTSGTTINETRMTLAADDAEADFQIYANVPYDGNDARHVTVGVQGVVMKLRAYMGQVDKAEEIQAKWHGLLKDLARVTGRDRVTPTTTSPVVDSSERNADGSSPLSRFDRRRFDPTRPGPPAGGTSDDLPD